MTILCASFAVFAAWRELSSRLRALFLSLAKALRAQSFRQDIYQEQKIFAHPLRPWHLGENYHLACEHCFFLSQSIRQNHHLSVFLPSDTTGLTTLTNPFFTLLILISLSKPFPTRVIRSCLAVGSLTPKRFWTSFTVIIVSGSTLNTVRISICL